MSETPDTLISRKYGDKKADEVSSQARELLSFKDDESFSDKLNEFDNYLYENKLKITLPAPQDPIYQMHLQ